MQDSDLHAKLKEMALALAEATLALEKEKKTHSPIAITGMACRFPQGAHDPQAFWELLREGKDGISPVPPDRWSPEAYADKIYCTGGGFLTSSIADFDPQFFNISPREAEFLDPQQRLLLEVTYEALLNANIQPSTLKGSRTGVFVGICTNDYALLTQQHADINPYVGTGTSHSTAAGRISYVFGLEGPSLAVDTACSSSLVALHLATLSLQRGECDTAIVAGVNLILSPEVTLNFCEAKMLSPDSHCKTFDAAADGYVRSEGCGVVILKRVQDTSYPLAIIRASGINQDGASGGLTVPNGTAQENLLKDVLMRSGLTAEDITYIEAHGTGTSLGDPIEIGALKKVYTHDVMVGAVKSNIGHLEAAAGMAGLIKILLMFQHKKIPPNLHFENPNPLIDFSHITVPTQPLAWEDKKRYAALSSFGFSGTNAHIILEAPENFPDITYAHPPYQKKRYWFSRTSHDNTWLNDHQIFDLTLFPAAGFLYTFLEKSQQLEKIIFEAPLVGTLSTKITEHNNALSIGNNNVTYARAEKGLAIENLSIIPKNYSTTVSPEIFYTQLNNAGFKYGPAFRPLVEIAYQENHIFGKLVSDKPIALIDGIFQLLGIFAEKNTYLPAEIEAVTQYQSIPGEIYAYAECTQTDDALFMDVIAYDKNQQPVLMIKKFMAKKVDPAKFEFSLKNPTQWFYFANLKAKAIDAPNVEEAYREHVVFPWIEEDFSPEKALTQFKKLFDFLQDLLQQENHYAIWITCEAHSLSASLLSGFQRAFNLEYPEMPLFILHTQDPEIVKIELAAKQTIPEEIFYIQNTRYVIRLEKQAPKIPSEKKPLSQGTYLITGGFGSMGIKITEWLYKEGIENIALMGRHLPTDENLKEKLSTLPVTLYEGDVSNYHDVKRVLKDIQENHPPLVGIFHTAGVIADGAFIKQQWETFSDVYKPKVFGGWYLHQALLELNIEVKYFVLFSSAAAILGSGGQTNYSSANSFLEGLSEYRKKLGLSALTIEWGPWSEAGLSANLTDYHKKIGIHALKPSDIILTLQYLLCYFEVDVTNVMVSDIDWKLFLQRIPTHIKNGLFDVFASFKSDAAKKQLEKADATRIENFLKETISDILKLEIETLDIHRDLWELGMDSLMALQLKNTLVDNLPENIKLDSATFLTYRTIEALRDYIANTTTVVTVPTKTASITAPVSMKDFTNIENFPEYQQLKLREKQFLSMMGRNCYFTINEGLATNTTLIDRRLFINYSAYNYLGLSGDKRVIQAANDAMHRYGTSVSASRLAAGEKPLHEDLEHEIARFLGTEASLVFTTGHTTNVATISLLMRPQDLILCDALSHNSILMGATFSGATRIPFPHNDFSVAEKILAEVRHKYERVLIVIEGVYSMDGDIPDIRYAIDLKNRYDALLMVDEAHSLGVIGKTGRGIVEYGGVNSKDIDILMGTLSKSLASCGGYIAGKKALIDYVKYSSGSFVYSVGITPQNAAAALASLKILEKETWRVTQLQENANYFLTGAKKVGLNTGNSKNSAVVPIIIGDSKKCLQLSSYLYQQGINALPITFPAVEEEAARFRFFITSQHTQEQMDETINVLSSFT